jgi:hypothetical protein
MNKLLKQIEKMKADKLENYVLPGLSSHLVSQGKIRLFEMSRNQQNEVTPHSHRFDFACLVMEGYVLNKLWEINPAGDEYEVSQLSYSGQIGRYSLSKIERQFFHYKEERFNAGEVYAMYANEIHSIYFSRGAKVLFFEGPAISKTSLIIEPVVNGLRVPTFKTEPWMFI